MTRRISEQQGQINALREALEFVEVGHHANPQSHLCARAVLTDSQPLADKIAADLRAEGAAPFRRALETLLIDLAYTQGGKVGLMPAVQEARALLATTPTEGHTYDHDGTYRHHHHFQTGAPEWWQNVEHFGGERREHRHPTPTEGEPA